MLLKKVKAEEKLTIEKRPQKGVRIDSKGSEIAKEAGQFHVFPTF